MSPAPAKAGLRFECTRCAKCCTNRGEYAHVYVSEAEVREIAALLGLSRKVFKRRYTFLDDQGYRQLTFTQDRCIFLDARGACGIYGARPTQCRTFPFWPELVTNGRWNPEARRLCEGVGQGPLHAIEDAEALIREFQESDPAA